MRTANKESDTKNRLLDSAQQLMMSKGYVATSVDEICAEAKVTKGSFFHYFKTKEDLAKVLLERFAMIQSEMMKEAIYSKTDDPLERIYGLIDFAIKISKDPNAKGCLVGTFAQEISETHPELRDICAKNFKNFAETMREDLVRAKAQQKIKADIDVNSLADYILSVIQGSLVVIKARQDRKIMEKNLIHLKTYISTIFGN